MGGELGYKPTAAADYTLIGLEQCCPPLEALCEEHREDLPTVASACSVVVRQHSSCVLPARLLLIHTRIPTLDFFGSATLAPWLLVLIYYTSANCSSIPIHFLCYQTIKELCGFCNTVVCSLRQDHMYLCFGCLELFICEVKKVLLLGRLGLY